MSVKVVVAAGAVAFLLILFLYHTYVHPFTSQVAIPHKVAPMAGMPDDYPYNTKEWQEAFKKGRTTMLSGVPQHAGQMRGAPGTTAPAAPSNP